MRAFILAIALLSTPATAADQFDLVCKSPETTVRYRVDIAKGEACADKCDRVWKMGSATSGELKIIDRTPAYRGDLEERSFVNRQSGEWTYTMSLHGRPDGRKGQCEVAPFSGFPATKF